MNTYNITGHDWGTPLPEFTGSRNEAITHLLNIQDKHPGAIMTLSYGMATLEIDLAEADIVSSVLKMQPKDAAMRQSAAMTEAQLEERARKAVAAREAKRNK